MSAIEGAGNRAGLVITREYGLYRATTQEKHVSGGSIESVLAKLAPEAPESYVAQAAEVIGGIFGEGEEE